MGSIPVLTDVKFDVCCPVAFLLDRTLSFPPLNVLFAGLLLHTDMAMTPGLSYLNSDRPANTTKTEKGTSRGQNGVLKAFTCDHGFETGDSIKGRQITQTDFCAVT